MTNASVRPRSRLYLLLATHLGLDMETIRLGLNDDPCTTWVWAGELDLGDCAGLRQTWRGLMADGLAHVVIDTTAVTFIDCSVLSCLIAAKREVGSRLAVHTATGPVRTLLELTGLDDFLIGGEVDTAELASRSR